MPRKKRIEPTFRKVPPIDPAKPMTTAQVADFLRCSRRKVYSLVKAGKIPAVKVGNTLLFSPRKVYEVAGMGDFLADPFQGVL